MDVQTSHLRVCSRDFGVMEGTTRAKCSLALISGSRSSYQDPMGCLRALSGVLRMFALDQGATAADLSRVPLLMVVARRWCYCLRGQPDDSERMGALVEAEDRLWFGNFCLGRFAGSVLWRNYSLIACYHPCFLETGSRGVFE